MDVDGILTDAERKPRSKADLRAAMDALGVQRKALADLCGVSPSMIGSWLSVDNPAQPPEWIWGTLHALHGRQQSMADDLWDAGSPIPIYASQRHYDACNQDGQPYELANQAALMAAHDLHADGKDVAFYYPEPNV